MKQLVNTRIWKETRDMLKFIAVMKKKSMISVMHDLIANEYEYVKNNQHLYQ